jgi:hypothetical protein
MRALENLGAPMQTDTLIDNVSSSSVVLIYFSGSF